MAGNHRRIRIERRTTSQDATYGTPLDSWTTVGEYVAEVDELAGSESPRQGIAIAERPTKISMRWVDGITSAMRVIDLDRGSRVMKIVSRPVEIGRRKRLEFMTADFTTSGNAE